MLHAFISTCKLKRVSSRREKIKKQKRKNNNASRSRVARVTTLRLRACTARAFLLLHYATTLPIYLFPCAIGWRFFSRIFLPPKLGYLFFLLPFLPLSVILCCSLYFTFRFFSFFFKYYFFFYTREVVPRTRSESDLRDIVRARRNGNVSKKGVFEKYTVAV